MGNQQSLQIIHYNDVYDVTRSARFVQKIRKVSKSGALNIFSGDIFFPSFESTLNEGWQMVTVMDQLKTDLAIPGNHDVEDGEEHFLKLVNELRTKWLLSNLRHKKNNEIFCKCEETMVIERGGFKIGIIGLIDHNWIDTSVLDINDFDLDDYKEKGKELSAKLKEQGCDLIIAITHMKNKSDEDLLDADNDIDLILGGHDHLFLVKRSKEKVLLKSGSNFEMFTSLTISKSKKIKPKQSKMEAEEDHSLFYFSDKKGKIMAPSYMFSLKRDDGYLNIGIKTHSISEKDSNCPTMKKFIEELRKDSEAKMSEPIVWLDDDLDLLSNSVRTRESAFGSFTADIVKFELDVHVAMVQGGCIRPDKFYKKDTLLTNRDIYSMFPYDDSFYIHEMTGNDLKIILEQSYQHLPGESGSFMHLGGARIVIDLSKEPMDRLDPKKILIQGVKLDLKKTYRVAAMSYISKGKDGLTHFKNVKRIGVERKDVVIQNALLRFFDVKDNSLKVQKLKMYRNKEIDDKALDQEKEDSEGENEESEKQELEEEQKQESNKKDKPEALKMRTSLIRIEKKDKEAIRNVLVSSFNQLLKKGFIKDIIEKEGKNVFSIDFNEDGRLKIINDKKEETKEESK